MPNFLPAPAVPLTRSPSARQSAARRRLVVLAAVLALAGIGGAIGLLTAPRGPAGPAAATGPFSYFPS